MPELKETIRQLALDCGYSDCGFTDAAPFHEFEQAVRKRMDTFPEAAHHYKGMLHRTDPKKKHPWVNSIIVCVLYYGKYRIPGELDGIIGKHYLFDRRYPECPDSAVPNKFKQALKDLGLRVKKGGVPDRWAGARAGVTRFARNNFAYSEKFGSWVNVEPWLVDAELPADEPASGSPCPDTCTACSSSCPTGALCGPYSMRMDHCIAYLTYSEKLPLDPELESRMGEWIYGCDVCQDVCPLNKDKWHSTTPASWLLESLDYLTPEVLAEMDLDTYRNIVHPLFWYISDDEDGLARWRNNAKRSLRNSK